MDILIRHVEPEDIPALYAMFQDPQVIWGTVQIPYLPMRRIRERVVDLPEGAYSLVACVEDEVAGTVGLQIRNKPRRNHAATLGISVRATWHGRGVGTALLQAVINLADNWLNLTRLELEVWTDNEPAIRLYTKAGFAIEGTHKAYAFRDGIFIDAHTMARLRPPPTIAHNSQSEF